MFTLRKPDLHLSCIQTGSPGPTLSYWLLWYGLIVINKLDLMLQSHVIPTGEGFLGFRAALLLFILSWIPLYCCSYLAAVCSLRMVPSESLLTAHWGTHFGIYRGLVTSLHRRLYKLRKRFKRNLFKNQIKCKKLHSSQQRELHFEPRPSLRDSVNALLGHFVHRGSILHSRHDPSPQCFFFFFTAKKCFFCQAITLSSIPRISLRRPSSSPCSHFRSSN